MEDGANCVPLNDALENLSPRLTYSPQSRTLCLAKQQQQPDSTMSSTPQNYVPKHRKAFSLPRTLEPGASPVPPDDPVPTDPPEFLYKHRSSDVCSLSSLSSLSSSFSSTPDNKTSSEASSSKADSGIVSRKSSNASTTSTSTFGIKRKSFYDFLPKGLFTSSKSAGDCTVTRVTPLPDPCASTQSLIMEGRPPNLPSKEVDEEQKHIKQYQDILQRAKKKDLLSLQFKLKNQAISQEDEMSARTTKWRSVIIPNWGKLKVAKSTQTIWWHGLPPSVRGTVWKLSVANELSITSSLYKILLDRADKSSDDLRDSIAMDADRTFPNLSLFQKDGPYHDALLNILYAYSVYRPDVSYVQGMSFVAAILILNLDEVEAFVMFCNLLNMKALRMFFNLDRDEMQLYYTDFDRYFHSCLPKLAEHLKEIGVSHDMFLMEWVMTLFAKALPLDVTCRIWDMICRDGEGFIALASLGILKLFEGKLLSLDADFTEASNFLCKLPDDLSVDSLFEAIRTVQNKLT